MSSFEVEVEVTARTDSDSEVPGARAAAGAAASCDVVRTSCFDPDIDSRIAAVEPAPTTCTAGWRRRSCSWLWSPWRFRLRA